MRAELQLGPRRPEGGRDLEVAAGHQRFRREREVAAGLDDDVAADAPAQAEPRHLRVAVAVEVGVVAAEGEHELAAVLALEPDDVGEAAGDLDVGVEQPRVVGELPLHPEHALRARESHEERELDRDERRLRPRQRHAREAEQVDVEPVADLHSDDGDAVDEGEAGEGEPGGEPEGAALHREDLPERAQLRHRVAGRGGDVERLDERVVAEARQVRRDDEPPVDAEAAADAGEEEGRRPAERPVHRADGEEGGELLRADDALAVAAVDRDPVHAEAAEQHAEVLDPLVGGLLEQPAGDRDAAHVGRHGEAGEVHRPARGAERVAVRGDVGDLQVVHRAGEPEHRHRAVHEHRHALDAALRRERVEAHLLEVERAEAALDRDPPRPRAVAGAERDAHRRRAVLLHRERGGEGGLRRRRAAVAHDAARDAVLAPRVGGRHGEVGELELHAAAPRPRRRDLGEDVQRDRVEREADVEQRARAAPDAQPDAVDGERRLEGERAGGAQQADEDAALRRRVPLDPAAVVLEPERDVAGDDLHAVGEPDREPDDAPRGGEAEGERRDGDREVGAGDVGEEPLRAGEQRARVEDAGDERRRRRVVLEDHAAQQPAHVRGAHRRVEQLLHGVLRDRDGGDEVGHRLDDAQRDLPRIGRLDRRRDGAVAGHEGEAAAVEQPAGGEAVRVVERHADRDPRAAHRREPTGDGHERPQHDAARVDRCRARGDAGLVEPRRAQREREREPLDPRHRDAVADDAHDARRRRPGERDVADRDRERAARGRDAHRGRHERVEQRRERVQPRRRDRRHGGRERGDRVGGPGAERGRVEALRRPAAQGERVADRADERPDRRGELRELVEQEGERHLGRGGERAEAGEGDEREVGARGRPDEQLDAAGAEAQVHRAAAGARAAEADVRLDAEQRRARRADRERRAESRGETPAAAAAGRRPRRGIDDEREPRAAPLGGHGERDARAERDRRAGRAGDPEQRA